MIVFYSSCSWVSTSMATYTELYNIATNTTAGTTPLNRNVHSACHIAMVKIFQNLDSGSPFSQEVGMHDKRVKWAIRVLNSPNLAVEQAYRAVVYANATATESQILNADGGTVVQPAIEAIIDSLAQNLE
jgi:predicted transcriptional regulator